MIEVVAVTAASPIHDERAVEAVATEFLKEVSGLYTKYVGKVTAPGSGIQGDLALILVATGGSERVIVDIAQEIGSAVLVAHDAMNSFPAALEALSYLRDEGVAAFLAILGRARPVVEAAVAAATAAATIRGAKIGVLGEPSPWLVYSGKNIKQIEKQLGLKLEVVGLEKIYDRFRSSAPAKLDAIINSAFEIAVKPHDIDKASRLYSALSSMVEERGWLALTIRCFDIIRDLGVTPCLPLAILNSEGVVAGCEGDLSATITMLFLKLLSGKPAFMGNVVRVEGHYVWLAHCMAPLAMTLSYSLVTHYETGQGVAVQGTLPVGLEVTLARYDHNRGVVRAFRGRIAKGDQFSRHACRTQVIVKAEGDPSAIVSDPIGNHYALVYGDVTRSLRFLARLFGLAYEGDGEEIAE